MKLGMKHEQPDIIFELEEGDFGEVILVGEDKDGNVWSLLQIMTDGTVILCEGVPKELGLKVDGDGYLKVEKEA